MSRPIDDDLINKIIEESDIDIERIQEESAAMTYDLALYGYSIKRNPDGTTLEAFLTGDTLVMKVDGKVLLEKVISP